MEMWGYNAYPGDALGYVLLGFQPVFDLIISFTGQQ